MTKKKKHDLRDEIPATMSITNTNSRMAGGADNPNVSTDEALNWSSLAPKAACRKAMTPKAASQEQLASKRIDPGNLI